MDPASNNESLDRRLAQVDIPEVRYRADMELHDRSQSYSAELLKLALAGIGVVGFLLVNIPKARSTPVFGDTLLTFLFSASVVAFAISVAFALLHRFYASGANFHHLQAIKLLLLNDSSLDAEVDRAIRIRTTKFLQCHSFLKAAALLLLVGACLLSGAFIRLMFSGG